MFRTIKRIVDWCGEFKGKLYLGFFFSFLSHIFAAMPVMVAAYTIGNLMETAKVGEAFDKKWIGYSILLILALVFLRFLFDYFRARCQEAISYELIARDRLAVGVKAGVTGVFPADEHGKYINLHNNRAWHP